MIEILEKKQKDNMLYTCVEGDTLESIAAKFGVSVADIMRDNPLFSSVYAGCVLYLTGLGKTRVFVKPLQTIDDVAEENGVSVESIMRLNGLTSRRVFVGMQLLIDKKGR